MNEIAWVMTILLWVLPIVVLLVMSLIRINPGCHHTGLDYKAMKSVLIGCFIFWILASGFTLRLLLISLELHIVGWIVLAFAHVLLWTAVYFAFKFIYVKRRGYKERIKMIEKHAAEVIYQSNDYNAFPKLLKLKDGRLWLCFYQGNGHVDSNNAGKLMHCFSEDDGKSWSESRVLADHPKYDTRNPALGQLKDGTLIAMIGIYDRNSITAKIQSQWIYSKDGSVGEDWSAPIDIMLNEYGVPDGFEIAWLSPYGNLFEVNDAYYAAYYGNNDPSRKRGEESVLLLELDFVEKKWKLASVPAKAPDNTKQNTGKYPGYNEAVIQPAGDKWLCLVRSSRQPGRHLYMTFSDNLLDWSIPKDTGIFGQAPELIHIDDMEGGIIRYFIAYRAENAYTRGGIGKLNIKTLELESENRILRASPGLGGGDSSYVSGVYLNEQMVYFVDYHVLKCKNMQTGTITGQLFDLK